MVVLCCDVIILLVSLSAIFSAPNHDRYRPEHEISRNTGSYAFSYSVDSPSNGDIKRHSETGNGDTVTGEYSLLQPDGCTRHVRYTAGPHGFEPVIQYEGNCNPENYAVGKNSGTIVTHYTIPVEAPKRPNMIAVAGKPSTSYYAVSQDQNAGATDSATTDIVQSGFQPQSNTIDSNSTLHQVIFHSGSKHVPPKGYVEIHTTAANAQRYQTGAVQSNIYLDSFKVLTPVSMGSPS